MNRVTAVVVNWNRPQDTLECLHSLAAQQPVPPELVVVDNGSTDGSADIIRAAFPEAVVIANTQNRGFGGGYNQGVGYAFDQGADLVFLINNDATLDPTALQILISAVQGGAQIAAPIIYYASRPDLVWSAGGRVSPWNLEVRGHLRGQHLPPDLPEIIERGFLTGCALLVSRTAFEKTGLFDEDFHLYYEDSDLCARMRKLGLRMVVCTRASAWHKVSLSSGGSGSPNERYWMARSSIQFFKEHARWWQWPVILFIRVGSAIKTTVSLLLRGKRESAQAYLRGLKDGLNGRSS